MSYKRRNYAFEARLAAIADRKRVQKKPAPKRNRLTQAFAACVKALLNR